MNLRKLLGGSGRVKKATSKSSSSRPRRKASTSTTQAASTKAVQQQDHGSGDGQLEDDDDGDDEDSLVQATLATVANIGDTPQAVQYIRQTMFSPVPQRAAGMSSTRVAEVLNYRRQLPPAVSVAHVQGLLASSSWSPTAVDRELAGLVRAGVLRKVVVAQRQRQAGGGSGNVGVGESVVLATDLERLVDECGGLAAPTRGRFKDWLRANPQAQTVTDTVAAPLPLSPADVEALFRAGFVTAHHAGTRCYAALALSETMHAHAARPGGAAAADKTTLVSLEAVARQQPGGSLGAVNGVAGGRAVTTLPHVLARPGNRNENGNATELRLALPGHGAFIDLAAAAVEHLVELLTQKGKGTTAEAPECVLRERWDGGGGGAHEAAYQAGKRARGEFAGVLPGRTRKWRRFRGLAFEWVLREAVGAGRVEVFATGSVGRGVRAV